MLCLTRDDFVMTSAAAINPAAAAIQRASAECAQRAGLLDESSKRRFAAFNTLVSHVYPIAEIDRAVACAAWCNWLFFFDDVHDEDLEGCADPDHVTAIMRRYLAVLRDGGAIRAGDPLSRLIIDFRERALRLASPAWLARFCRSVEDYFFRGVAPAVVNWVNRRTPPLAEYLVQREHDSAVHTALDLVEIADGITLPDHVMTWPLMQRTRRACARTIAYFNDIVSYPKEVLVHENPNNLVHVLAAEGRSYEEALAEAVRIVNDEARTMLALADEVVAEDAALGPEVARYVGGLARWQRGNIESSLIEARYRSERSPFHELRPVAAAVEVA